MAANILDKHEKPLLEKLTDYPDWIYTLTWLVLRLKKWEFAVLGAVQVYGHVELKGY